MEEFQDVLLRDFEYSDSQITHVLQLILFLASVVEVKSEVCAAKDDPEDDKVLACALDGHATHVLSYDRHLLKLGVFEGIKIVKPEDIEG